MKDLLNKFVVPVIIVIIGVLLLVLGKNNDQNSLFILGAGAILLIGLISLLNSLDIISKVIKMAIMAVLVISSVSLAYLDFRSIKDPVDFQNEKNRRYEYVVQRLKDLRTAEIAYKARIGGYCDNLDSLLKFVQVDSFLVVKAIGTVPDTLTEEQAVELGIVRRDSSKTPVMDSIFNSRYLAERKVPFYFDSLSFIPFTNGKRFDLKAGIIDKNNVKVAVFEIKDAQPFDKRDVKKVGSMSDPSTSGNWE